MDSIKSLCSQISKESKCPLCKGSFHMDECQKCGYKSVLIKECIDKLLPMLDQNVSSEELLSLYTIKSLGYDRINMLLSLSGVEDYLKSKEEKILNQSRYELSDERVMLYFIENNFPNKNKMINNLIKEMLSDNLDITDEEKLSLFKYFVEYVTSNNFECVFTSSNSKKEIIFNENDIRRLFYQKKYLELLETAFYKCNYACRSIMLENGKGSLKEIKEKIIIDNLPDYYEENSNALFIEINCRYNANILLRDYISSLGFKMSDMLLKCYEEREKNYLDLLNSNYRVYHGKSVNIDDLFLEIISKLDINFIKEKYPILNIENNDSIKKL